MEKTWPHAIQQVLDEADEPLHYGEIADRIIEQCLRINVGKTPRNTVNSVITTSIKTEGTDSLYVRVGKGIVTLKSKMKEPENKEEETTLVSSFGMFWRREEVEWTGRPKLLGVQQAGAEPVDFSKQIGLYLLYDGREVIHVGRARTEDSALGGRLYAHTKDRLSARWDRFSCSACVRFLMMGNLVGCKIAGIRVGSLPSSRPY